MSTTATPTEPASTLVWIAAEIRAEVEAADRDWRSALGHAIRAGELLIEAKAQLKHGEWLPWLEANGLGERNARNYMRLAANRQEPAVLEGLTIEGALKQLATPRQDRDAGDAAAFGEEKDAAVVAFLFGACAERAPAQVRAASQLMLRWKALDDYFHGHEWLKPPGDYLPDDEQREVRWLMGDAQRLATNAVAERTLVAHEIRELVPEFEDAATRAAIAERARVLCEECDGAIAELEHAGVTS